MTDLKMSKFSRDIMEQKYSHELPDGSKESWEDIAHRVPTNVMKAVDAPKAMVKEIEALIAAKKFMPGGRYLYASGRPFHQVQNCLLMRAEDSREGWADIMFKGTMALMTGAGIGVDYSALRAKGTPIIKTGGKASGPCALMQMLNEAGRGIRQGGDRRSAIWAGLSWSHDDVMEFITLKNWSPEVRAMKEKDPLFPAPMDGTNISVILDDEFFKAFESEKHKLHDRAQEVYWAVVKSMLKTAEPGFSVDTGDNAGETLRNAPVSGDTFVLTDSGYVPVREIAGDARTVWTGKRWARTTFKKTGEMVPVVRVKMTGSREIVCDPSHPFIVEDGGRVNAADLEAGQALALGRPPDASVAGFSPSAYTLGYVFGDGTFHTQYPRAEATFCTPESKSCVEMLDRNLITSINHSDGRGFTRVYFRNDPIFARRSKATFPADIYSADPGAQASFLAGLFDSDGNYFQPQNRVRLSSKHEAFLIGARRLLEGLGILSGISTAGISTYGQSQGYTLTIVTEHVTRFSKLIPTRRLRIASCESYREAKIKVLGIEDAGFEDVFCCDVGVNEHSFMAEGVLVSNCTEVTSSDDSDICNLGSINMAQINSLDEMRQAVELGVAFLVAGTEYSDVPYEKVKEVRRKNRRLGLGLMGLHEWLLKRGKKYGPDAELEEYLKIYATSTEVARRQAKEWGLSAPVKTRAIAPTGTIGIVAETTTGIEPIFCVAYKRRYVKGDAVQYQYVVDPAAQRLIDSGLAPESIEDAYSLAEDVERRVAFQAWVQKYVDHSISSTINLPEWGSELNNSNRIRSFGNMLMRYLPQLRGMTVYPDGARGGQPLSPVKYATAISHVGKVFLEQADVCDISRGGSCGA